MAKRSRGAKASKKPGKRYSVAVTLLISVAAFLAIAFLILTPGDAIIRFFVAVAVLMISGRTIATANGIPNSYGAYLLGGKRGIKLIEGLSKKNPRLWIAFADWGLAFSFGLASYFLFGRYVSKKMMALGIGTTLAVLFLVFPYLPVVLNFINIPQISSQASAAAQPAQGVSPVFLIFAIASILGGFSLSTILLIFISGGSILYSVLLFLASAVSSHPNTSILTQQVPGVAPLIPGLTIPFFAGIISLFILLVVHEFSHGVLAKIAKVRIKSIGAILFGIVPMGAFVEPDESEVKKLKESYQNRISIAGVSANMLTSLLFLVFTIIVLFYLLPSISTGGVLVTQAIKGYPAYGVIAPNSIILMWNSVQINNAYQLGAAEAGYTGGKVNVTTNEGTFALTPVTGGKIGIDVAPAQITLSYQAANFIYAIVALSFGLNFFVAIFNLLPIPGFDGWRIYQSKIKSKKVLKAIAILLVLAILLNVLPWFWTIG